MTTQLCSSILSSVMKYPLQTEIMIQTN